jgi:ABC-type sugar transport system ATPase subunit
MLKLENLSIHSGSFVFHIQEFVIPSPACVALMGPSGSGKTTLMEAICGLRKITAGSMQLNGQEISHRRPADRQVALVPQDNVLFPHLNVSQHLSFGPSIQKWQPSAIDQRVEELADQLKISHLLQRMPDNLSGGEAKRVALGRALATHPKLLCLDEAFTGMDDQCHAETLELVKQSIAQENTTTLHITHSHREAHELADQVIQIHNLIATSPSTPSS